MLDFYEFSIDLFCSLVFLVFSYLEFQYSRGWSAASFAITTISSPSEIFGSELLNIEEIVGLEGRNFYFLEDKFC